MVYSFHTPPGLRIYAIGDVHGRLDLLDQLLAKIALDFAESRVQRRLLVFLGDYVDRGPDSRGVIERLAQGALPGFEHIYLTGNHEDLMLRFLADPEEAGAAWLWNGGQTTLASYGIASDPLIAPGPSDLLALRDALLAALPAQHRQFLDSLKHYHVEGDLVFVHAGLKPGRLLARQAIEDMLWIRDEFLTSPADFGKLVIHGHTVTMAPEARANRVGIDTGAWKTGHLTALGLEAARRWFLHT
jgi:serine/threonine protein phosphatase 1